MEILLIILLVVVLFGVFALPAAGTLFQILLGIAILVAIVTLINRSKGL